jgi:hypothetical protein
MTRCSGQHLVNEIRCDDGQGLGGQRRVGWFFTRLDIVQGVFEEVPAATCSIVAAVLDFCDLNRLLRLKTVFCILD